MTTSSNVKDIVFNRPLSALVERRENIRQMEQRQAIARALSETGDVDVCIYRSSSSALQPEANSVDLC